MTQTKVVPCLAVAGLAALLASTPLAGQEIDLHRLEHVADSMAYQHIASRLAPGISVAVARGGQVLFAKGYGLADVEQGVAAGPETVYRIGSITKQFTAAAVMRLVEAGTVSLDDPITDYLPDYPTQGHTVTIRHLLNHTSGIRSYTGLGDAFWSKQRLDLSESELIDLFDDLTFDFEPGTKYSYNNSAYYLLGVILGKVAGMPYARYIETSLLQPLGLEHTLYCDNRRIIPDRAEGYDYDEDGLLNAEYISMANPGAAGSLCSTVGDLVRWTELLHDGDVVTPASFRAMTAPTVLTTGDTIPYGFGLALGDLEGHRSVAHGGGINGFVTYLVRYPAEELTIVVLTNSGGGDPDRIADALARTIFGIPFVVVTDVPLSAAEMERYVGEYLLKWSDQELPIRIYVDGERLMAQAESQQPSLLHYQGDDTFIPDFDDDVRLVFEVAGDQAEAVTLHQGGAAIRGERVK